MMKKFLLTFLIVLLPISASAQLSVPQGGTGRASFTNGAFIYSNSDSFQRLTGTTSPFFSTFSFGTATGTSATTTNLHASSGITTPKITGVSDLLLSHSNGLNYYYAGPTYIFQQWYNGTNSTDFLLQGGGTQLYSDTAIDIQSATGQYGFYNGTDRSGQLLFTSVTGTDKTFTFPNTTGTVCLTITCLTSYDAFTHPSAGVSATTSQMIFTNASSTFTGNLNISGNSTTTHATTTNSFATTASSTNLFASVFNFGTSIIALVADTITAGAKAIIDFGGALSFEIPNGASPTVDAAGEIAVDTTTGQLKWYDGTRTQLVTGTTTKAFNIASTTLDAMGNSFNLATTTLLLMNNVEPLTMTGFYCTASTTGTALVRFGDGTNWTTESTCTSGGFTPTVSNNTFTAFEAFNVQASSTAGAVSRITVTAVFSKTQD